MSHCDRWRVSILKPEQQIRAVNDSKALKTFKLIFLSPVLPKPEVTSVTSPSGVTEANCTAQSRPAAEITWNVGGDNRTLGPPISSEYPQGDGTTVVTSTLLYQSGLLSDLYVQCIVHHRGLEKPLAVSLHTNGEELITSI